MVVTSYVASCAELACAALPRAALVTSTTGATGGMVGRRAWPLILHLTGATSTAAALLDLFDS